MQARPLALFEGYGIEIESMVVDAETLDVLPVVDELLRAAGGGDEWVDDFDDGPIGWSNELVTHVVELKTNGPVPRLDGVAADFLASGRRLAARLEEGWGARLLPTAMHPWMEPPRETRLWPHGHGEVYGAYDRLFDCRRHGWANLQSVHLNLPFADEHEFARLMAATRLVLPLVPALCASSPLVEGRVTGALDNRLVHYRDNSARVPTMTGRVVPEPVYSFGEYHDLVLGGIDRELEALGAERALLGNEWTNARGAIARFDRMAVEIRLIDAQEDYVADLAVAGAVAALVRALVEERWGSFRRQSAWDTDRLVEQLERAVAEGPRAPVLERDLAAQFGRSPGEAPTLGALLRRVVPEVCEGPAELEARLDLVLREGTLAERILAALPPEPDRADLRSVYGRLADGMLQARAFLP